MKSSFLRRRAASDQRMVITGFFSGSGLPPRDYMPLSIATAYGSPTPTVEDDGHGNLTDLTFHASERWAFRIYWAVTGLSGNVIAIDQDYQSFGTGGPSINQDASITITPQATYEFFDNFTWGFDADQYLRFFITPTLSSGTNNVLTLKIWAQRVL